MSAEKLGAERPTSPTAADRAAGADLGDLAEALASLARSLQTEDRSQDVLEKIVRGAIALIPGVEEGSITTVRERRTVESWAPSQELARAVDALQTEVCQGPCLDAVYKHRMVTVPDMASEQRWPRFAERAAALGAASMMSFQLYVEGDNLGALNLYARSAGAFDEESEGIGGLFATHAAIALARVQQREDLIRAIDSRDLIGQAKGILMERHRLTADQAFSLLSHVSQQRNRKLRDVAAELTATGELRDVEPSRSGRR